MSQHLTMSSPAASARPTSQKELDRALDELHFGAERLTITSPASKARLVRECLTLVRQIMADWSRLGLAAKRLPPDSAEEWFGGPLPAVSHLRELASSLDQIAADGRPRMGTGIRHRADGRLEVTVHPAIGLDRVLTSGVRAHVLLQPGVTVETALEAQAPLYQRRRPTPTVALVLGAGNVSSLPITDVLTHMFNEGRACLLKVNPVNEWFGPLLERALQPLIDSDFLRVVYGGADVGDYLATHAGVEWIHVTGAAATHDQLLWGRPGPDHDRRRNGDLPPRVSVPLSAELGNITPVAVVPATYHAAELAFQARNVATMVTNNASFNCLSARMLVTAKGWNQRDEFLRLLRGFLEGTPTRYAYYPGAQDRYRQLTVGRDRQTIGDAGSEELPWTLIPGLDAQDSAEPLFQLEPFCCILTEVSVGGVDPIDFLRAATDFMNDTLWGTLCAAIIISPRLEQDPAIAAALDRAIIELRYGNVAINAWPALNVALPTLPWGGYGDDIGPVTQSGTGFVHNTAMLGGIDKGVLHANLTMRPTPPWFSDNPKGGRVAPTFVDIAAQPRWRSVPRLMTKMV
jgi:aldehyde dehydrogenase (NAD(P)+)